MKTTLNLSPEVTLPLQVVTEKIGVFGVSGSGKTYTGSVIAEEILLCGAPLVVIDPLGVWYGLRIQGDSGQTFPPLYILGGDHADLPLTPSSGAAIADLVVEERLSVILDLSHLQQDEQTAFIAAFARRLYQTNRTALHMIVDECDIAAPETPGSSTEWESRRALDNIVRRGRVRGIGITLITQRPAIVAKSLISQVGILAVHRLAAETDRKAIDGWVKGHGTDEERKRVLTSLSSLATGEAWFWSPETALLERTKVRKRYTFDSSATPEVGVDIERAEVKPLTPEAMARLRDRLQAEITEAQENDLDALRAQIAQLKQQLASSPTPKTIEVPVERIVERIVVKNILTDEARQTIREAMDTAATLNKELGNVHALLAALEKTPRQDEMIQPKTTSPAPEPKVEAIEAPVETPKPVHEKPRNVPAGRKDSPARPEPAGTGGLSRPQQAILNALADFAAVGYRDVLRPVIAVRTRVSPKSSSYKDNLSTLRMMELVTYPSGQTVALTDKGAAIAVGAQKPVTLTEYHDGWMRLLSGPQGAILKHLVEAYPDAVKRDDAAVAVGVSPTSSSYKDNLSTLRSFGLADYPDAKTVKGTPLLFPKGL